MQSVVLPFSPYYPYLPCQCLQTLTVQLPEVRTGYAPVTAEGVHLPPVGGVNTEQLHLVQRRAAQPPQFATALILARHTRHRVAHRTVLASAQLTQVCRPAVAVLRHQRLLVGTGHPP